MLFQIFVVLVAVQLTSQEASSSDSSSPEAVCDPPCSPGLQCVSGEGSCASPPCANRSFSCVTVCEIPLPLTEISIEIRETPCGNVTCPMGYQCAELMMPCLVAPCPKEFKCISNSGDIYDNSANSGKCAENEIYDGCGGCEATCENQNPICIMSCRPGQCVCAPGLVRHDGKCVPFSQCQNSVVQEDIPKCSRSEVYEPCGGCEPSCEILNPICTEECRAGQCVCAPGLVRRNGKCVPFNQCPNPVGINTTCSTTEEWSECASQCQETCRGTYEPCNTMTAAAVCTPGCVCKPFYKRNKNGKCVHNRECYQNPGCSTNEKWSRCANCESSCGEPSAKECTEKCTSGCACKPGYKRKDKECIAAEYC